MAGEDKGRMLLCASTTETSRMVSPSVNEWSCFETSGMMTTVERPHSDLLLQVEENREVKHRGIRFRERREGCRGPRGRSWSSGSRHREPSSGRGVQPGTSARAAETGDQKKERHGKKERKRSNTQAGRKKADTEERPQEPADKQRAGLGWERGPRKGRDARRLEANGRAGRGEGGALGETTPMGGRAGVTRSAGRAPPPARHGRGSFLFLPAVVGVGQASGHLPPLPAAGLARLPGRLCPDRTLPARSRRQEPWFRGPGRALSLATGRSPAASRGKPRDCPAAPAVSASLLLARDRGLVPASPGWRKLRGPGSHYLARKGRRWAEGSPSAGQRKISQRLRRQRESRARDAGFAGTPAGAIAPLGFRLARASISLHDGLSKAGSVQRLQRGCGGGLINRCSVIISTHPFSPC
ncbi:collagen alpha-1(III) chain-like [Pan troglodytes]|uniref:collagen alpha-1(III) chain-like n=1 Tax=Pan troglodytes TaxID=9598 RepID=UPI003013E9B6